MTKDKGAHPTLPKGGGLLKRIPHGTPRPSRGGVLEEWGGVYNKMQKKILIGNEILNGNEILLTPPLPLPYMGGERHAE